MRGDCSGESCVDAGGAVRVEEPASCACDEEPVEIGLTAAKGGPWTEVEVVVERTLHGSEGADLLAAELPASTVERLSAVAEHVDEDAIMLQSWCVKRRAGDVYGRTARSECRWA